MKSFDLRETYFDMVRVPDKTAEQLFKRRLEGGKVYIIPIDVGETIKCVGFEIERYRIFHPAFDERLYLIFLARRKNKKACGARRRRNKNVRSTPQNSYYTVSQCKDYVCLKRCSVMKSGDGTIHGTRKSETWEITSLRRIDVFR